MGGDRRERERERLRAVGGRGEGEETAREEESETGRRERGECEDMRTTCTQIKASMVEYKYSSFGICGMNARVCVFVCACVCQSLHLPCLERALVIASPLGFSSFHTHALKHL